MFLKLVLLKKDVYCALELNFFQLNNRKKNSSKRKEILVFLIGAPEQSEKKWTLAVIVRKEKIAISNE